MSNNERIRLEGELIGLKARCKTMEQIIYYSEEQGFEDAINKITYLLQDTISQLDSVINKIDQ